MKAIMGNIGCMQWLGSTMHQHMISVVDEEHAEQGTVRKCGSEFHGLRCSRVDQHDGFHFAREWNGEQVRVSAIWQKG